MSTQIITRIARTDAATFAADFPGELIGSSDWDSEAWANVPEDVQESGAGYESNWRLYRDLLHAVVAKTATGV